MKARIAIRPYGFGLTEATHSASTRGMPVNAMHEERKLAPARMNRIMHDRRVAPIRLALNVVQFRPPDHPAMTSAPSTPYAAAPAAGAPPTPITHTTKTRTRKTGP